MKTFSGDHQLLFSSVFSSPKCKRCDTKTIDFKVYVASIALWIFASSLMLRLQLLILLFLEISNGHLKLFKLDRYNVENRLADTVGEGEVVGVEKVALAYYTTTRVAQLAGAAAQHEAWELCDHQRVRCGNVGGSRQGRDIYTYIVIVGFHCCRAETNTQHYKAIFLN